MSLITNDTSTQGGGGFCHHTHNHHRHNDHSGILADIRKDIGDAQSTIKDSVQNLLLSQNLEFRHVNDRICDTEKESIKATLENKVKLMEVQGFLAKEISDKTCMLEKEMKEGFSEIKTSALQARLDCTRDELSALRCSSGMQSTLDKILAAIAGIPVVTPLK